jgi:Uri superfamily endonuclease
MAKSAMEFVHIRPTHSGAADRWADLPGVPGAYVLVIQLDAPLALKIASLAPAVLAPGRYAYCGNAHGRGGIRARLARHLRPGKPARWHVDHLTNAGSVVSVGVEPGGRECDLFARVLATAGARVPAIGFGSSDCRRCPAHLASVATDFDARALAPVSLSADTGRP